MWVSFPMVIWHTYCMPSPGGVPVSSHALTGQGTLVVHLRFKGSETLLTSVNVGMHSTQVGTGASNHNDHRQRKIAAGMTDQRKEGRSATSYFSRMRMLRQRVGLPSLWNAM